MSKNTSNYSCESTSTICSEADKAQPYRGRPRGLYESYLSPSKTEQPIEATDAHVRRNTSQLTRMMGGNTTDPAGREVGSRLRWQ